MRAYIELCRTLPKEQLEEVLIVAFFGRKLLLLRQGGRHAFPKARFEPAESLEKTIRRALYEQTGAFLKYSQLLGVLHFLPDNEQEASVQVAIYVGLVHHIERPVLRTEGALRVSDIDVAYRLLKQHYWHKTKAFLFRHAYERFKQLQEQDTKELVHDLEHDPEEER